MNRAALLIVLATGACGPAAAARADGPAIHPAFEALCMQGTPCAAPAVVRLDARATTADGVARPFHDLRYAWDCGDGSKPIASPISACVYEKPGKHAVTLCRPPWRRVGDEDPRGRGGRPQRRPRGRARGRISAGDGRARSRAGLAHHERHGRPGRDHRPARAARRMDDRARRLRRRVHAAPARAVAHLVHRRRDARLPRRRRRVDDRRRREAQRSHRAGPNAHPLGARGPHERDLPARRARDHPRQRLRRRHRLLPPHRPLPRTAARAHEDREPRRERERRAAPRLGRIGAAEHRFDRVRDRRQHLHRGDARHGARAHLPDQHVRRQRSRRRHRGRRPRRPLRAQHAARDGKRPPAAVARLLAGRRRPHRARQRARSAATWT